MYIITTIACVDACTLSIYKLIMKCLGTVINMYTLELYCYSVMI